MVPSRRTLLAGLGALLLPVPPSLAVPLTGREEPAFVTARRTAAGGFDMAILGPSGKVLYSHRIDARGHSAAVRREPRTAVVFARRPGRFALAVDVETLTVEALFAPPADRLFEGHGFFSADGKVLFATENDFDAERGVLGMYDATGGFARIGEIPTYGIGPHEALLMRDGRTIAVANGGIITHPDYPRQKLNLPDMQPNFTLIDANSGDLLGEAQLPKDYYQLSLRHMAEAAPGVVWFGGQYEGPKTDRLSLIGTFDAGRGLTLNDADLDAMAHMDRYVGSVAVTPDGETVITTSPPGGVFLEWDAATRRMRRMHEAADVAGTASAPAGYAVTTGTGVFELSDGTGSQSDAAFDNHLVPIPPRAG